MRTRQEIEMARDKFAESLETDENDQETELIVHTLEWVLGNVTDTSLYEYLPID